METLRKDLIENIDLILEEFNNDNLIAKKDELEKKVNDYKQYYRNKEKEYRLKNIEKIRERDRNRSREYYEKNKEKIKEKNRKHSRVYYEKNKEKLQKKHLEYYHNNREKMLEYSRNYRKRKKLEKIKVKNMFENKKIEFINNSLTSISQDIENLQNELNSEIDIYNLQLSLKDLRNRTKQLYIMVNDEVSLLNQKEFYRKLHI